MLAAVLSTVVPGANALIAVRAVDGVCQALVNPLALAVLAVTFDDEERPKALGIYGASLGIMGGLSSLAIQFLSQSFGWRAGGVRTHDRARGGHDADGLAPGPGKPGQ